MQTNNLKTVSDDGDMLILLDADGTYLLTFRSLNADMGNAKVLRFKSAKAIIAYIESAE